MPLRFIVIHLFAVFGIAASSIVPPPALARPLDLQDSSSGPGLVFRTDLAGDLWVESPLYTWNITGGQAIASTSTAQPWASAPPGQRLVDTLFLAASSLPEGYQADLFARLVFALPEEALVAVERPGPAGVDTLWLGLRLSDGLISLSHTFQGPAAPPLLDLPAQAARLRTGEG
jgi:hypothetical protein